MKTRKVGVVVGLIKNFKQSLLGRKERKAKKGKRARGERRETAVRLIKKFQQSLLGEERKESKKRETILYHFPFLAFFFFLPPKTPLEFSINTSTTSVNYTI